MHCWKCRKTLLSATEACGTTVGAKAAIWIFIHRYTVAQALEVVRAEEEDDYL
jgi:hypothetical protein